MIRWAVALGAIIATLQLMAGMVAWHDVSPRLASVVTVRASHEFCVTLDGRRYLVDADASRVRAELGQVSGCR